MEDQRKHDEVVRQNNGNRDGDSKDERAFAKKATAIIAKRNKWELHG